MMYLNESPVASGHSAAYRLAEFSKKEATMDANFSSALRRNLNSSRATGGTVLSLTMAVAFAMLTTPSAQAQVNQVAHNFVAGSDGGLPYAGLTIDAAENLYGTSTAGGILTGGCSPFGCGG